MQFSEFVLVKTGEIGPAYASGRQAAARERILSASGEWFRSIFPERRRWTLPDGGEAVLYQRFSDPPRGDPKISPDDLSALFPGAEWEGVTISLMSADEGSAGLPNPPLRPFRHPLPGGEGSPSVTPDPAELTEVRGNEGIYETRCRVRAGKVTLKGITIENFDADLEGFWPVRDDAGETRCVRLRRLTLRSARLTDAALLAHLSRKAKWLKKPAVRWVEGDALEIRGKAGILPLKVRCSFLFDNSREMPKIRLQLDKLSLGGVPLPVWLAGPLRRFVADVRPQPGMPFQLDWSPVRIEPAGPETAGALIIGKNNTAGRGLPPSLGED